jgi:hypothetical protein
MEKIVCSAEEKEYPKKIKKILLYLFKGIRVECNKELSKEIFFGGVKPWRFGEKILFSYPCEECK